MALISCPECNEQISDKAVSCPHCGFPIQPISMDNLKYDIELVTIGNNDDKIRTIRFLRETKGLSLAEAVNFVDTVPQIIFTNLTKETAEKTIETLRSFNNSVRLKQTSSTLTKSNDSDLKTYFEEKTRPLTCPICNSTNIVVGQKGFSFWTGFIGSNKTVNRCGNCGHTWKPNMKL